MPLVGIAYKTYFTISLIAISNIRSYGQRKTCSKIWKKNRRYCKFKKESETQALQTAQQNKEKNELLEKQGLNMSQQQSFRKHASRIPFLTSSKIPLGWQWVSFV